MADMMRWRYGDTKPVVMAVDAATVIEIGDVLWLDEDDVKPASDIEDQLTEAANQEALHDLFAGVAMQRSPAGDTRPIRVATAGVFEFNCVSGTYEVGEFFGVDEKSSGTQLESQKLQKVTAANLSIGRCAKRVPTADTKVLVEIVGTVSHGGPQTPA